MLRMGGQTDGNAILFVVDNAAVFRKKVKEVKYYGVFFFRRNPSQRKQVVYL